MTSQGWDAIRRLGGVKMAGTFEVTPEGLLWKLCLFLLRNTAKRGVEQVMLRWVPFRRFMTRVATTAIVGWMYRWADAATIGDYARIDHCWNQVRDLSDWIWNHGWLDWPEVETRRWASEPVVKGFPEIELGLSVTDPLAGSMSVREKPVIAGVWLEDGADSKTALSIAAFERQRWANILAGGEPMPYSWLQKKEGKRMAILAFVIN